MNPMDHTDFDVKRLENFEKMYQSIQLGYEDAIKRMDQLNRQGKNKSATYRQLMVQKMTYKNILELYETFGLT